MEQQQNTNWDDKDEKYRRRVIYTAHYTVYSVCKASIIRTRTHHR